MNKKQNEAIVLSIVFMKMIAEAEDKTVKDNLGIDKKQALINASESLIRELKKIK